ncbi:hypothetical protein V493_08673 [Pseudogymnoascus sp. VKM F-4281 (FW-2241)]|nr:hypothetical protein V493_08673 [Pseudogymnoascus sp. VKM F-4281 (FW-2241)]
MSFPSWTHTTHHDAYPSIDPSRPDLCSKGKVVIVTGGGRGIGRATALAFAKSGARAVVITSRSETAIAVVAGEINKLGCEARYYSVDAVDQTQIQEVFTATKAEFGNIDVVVNNAGYLPDEALIKDALLDDWWAAFEVNTKGGFIAIQAFVQHASPGATLISTVTALAHSAYYPGFSSYGASKLATLKVMQDVHEEHPEYRVFSIQPGIIDTVTSSKSKLPEQDTVDLPASFSVWLASAESDFVRGRMLWANWDVDELKAKKDEILNGDLLKIVLSGWP